MPAEPTKSTLKALGVLSDNVCAYPNCVAPIYDTKHRKLVGQVSHIKAKNPFGPRFDPAQSLFRKGTERWPNLLCIRRISRPDILMVDFDVKWEQYSHPITESILVSVYADDSSVAEAYFPIESMVNPERAAAFRELAKSVNSIKPI